MITSIIIGVLLCISYIATFWLGTIYGETKVYKLILGKVIMPKETFEVMCDTIGILPESICKGYERIIKDEPIAEKTAKLYVIKGGDDEKV